MNIQTAFTLGLIAGENVELKDLIFNQTEKPNPMFSIQQPPPLQVAYNSNKSTKAYLHHELSLAKSGNESLKFMDIGRWSLEIDRESVHSYTIVKTRLQPFAIRIGVLQF